VKRYVIFCDGNDATAGREKTKKPGGDQLRWGLFRFDISGISSAVTVYKARFFVKVGTFAGTGSTTVRAHRIYKGTSGADVSQTWLESDGATAFDNIGNYNYNTQDTLSSLGFDSNTSGYQVFNVKGDNDVNGGINYDINQAGNNVTGVLLHATPNWNFDGTTKSAVVSAALNTLGFTDSAQGPSWQLNMSEAAANSRPYLEIWTTENAPVGVFTAIPSG